jgi:hypothetical protein
LNPCYGGVARTAFPHTGTHTPLHHTSAKRPPPPVLTNLADPVGAPVPLRPPVTMSSDLDMSLDDLIKQSKSRPKASPASSSGPAHRALQAARAAPYPPAAPKVRCTSPPRPGLRGSGPFPPRENPNVATATDPSRPGPCRRLAIRDLCRPRRRPCRCRAGAILREVARNGDEAVHLQP